jgi:hypothetical protein
VHYGVLALTTQNLFHELFQEIYLQGPSSARRLKMAMPEQSYWQVLLAEKARVRETELFELLPNDQGLLFDPWPEATAHPDQVGQQLWCWGMLAGIPTGFSLRFLGIGRWRRYPAAHCTPPERVYQWQRRGHLRAPAGAGMSGELQRQGARALRMQILDLGAGGLRASVPMPRDYPLTVQENLPELCFSLAGCQHRVAARICHLGGPRRSADGIVQEIGVAFLAPPAALQESLIQLGLRYDREALRRTSLA